MKPRAYTPAQDAVIREYYGRVPVDTLAHVLERTECSVKSRATKLGLSLTRRREWQPAELDILRELYPTTDTQQLADMLNRTVDSITSQANIQGVHKTREYIAALGKKGTVHPKAVASRFQRGMTTWNKGKKGYMGANATSFRKGNLPHNTRQDGDLGVRTDSKTGKAYIYQRVSLAHWEPLHRLIWEQAHGPIPAGMIVVFRDGDASNVTLDNLEIISRVENMNRNTKHNIPEHMRDAHQQLKRLNQAIKDLTKNNKH